MNKFITWEAVFWASLTAVLYTYVLYPLLLLVLASAVQAARDLSFAVGRRMRRSQSPVSPPPSVAMLVSASDEEDVIEVKLRNTAELDYPAQQLEFLLGLDAPSDSTPMRAQRVTHPSFQVFHFSVRRGKLAVINDLAAHTSADILVFSDANTRLEPGCLRSMVRHFADPQVGAVCGELRLENAPGQTATESLYWRYEVALKFLENRLNCVLGANGAVYAIRRSHYHPVEHAIVEDFQIPMNIRYAGHRVVYDPEAIGIEEVAPDFFSEFRRKVRIGAGDYQILFGNLRFLNPFVGMPAFAYFSHKVLRWLAPGFLLTLLASSFILAAQPVYATACVAQLTFFLAALAGFRRIQRGRPLGWTSLPLYFSAMNLALLLGLLRLLSGRQKAVWGVTRRRAPGADVAHARGEVHE